MRTLLTISILFVASCGTPEKNSTDITGTSGNTKELQLPFKVQCEYFFNEVNRNFFGKDTLWRFQPNSEFYLLVKNQPHVARPVLVTMDMNGHTIDTLLLFDRECFIGVDSDYRPWLEIDKNLVVAWTDTAHYTTLFSNDNPLTDAWEIDGKTDTVIRIATSRIDKEGKIKPLQQAYNVNGIVL